MEVKRKSMKKLLYEFAALVDKQTQARKTLEYSEQNLKRAEKEYQELTQKLEKIQNEIVERDRLKDEYSSQ